MIEGIIKSAERYSDLWILASDLLEALNVGIDDEYMPEDMKERIIRHGLLEKEDE